MKKNYLFILAVAFEFTSFAQNVSVLTQRYNNKRNGWNSTEKTLNTTNVNAEKFGLLFTRTIDDQVYAQPLLVSNLLINGKTQNVVFVVTMNNSVYAFNADDSSDMTPLWHVNITSQGKRTLKSSDLPCSNYGSNIGIISTPVIDTFTSTMYLVSYDFSTQTNKPTQYIHALNILTGNERHGSPQPISASVPGIGQGSVNETIVFNPLKHNQRSALLLHNGVIYICWASFCDNPPYHGWMIGIDTSTLKNKYVYNDTPGDSAGGIWMAGNGPSVDDNGFIYVISGNGTVGTNGNPNNPLNRGESFLQFFPEKDSLKLVNFFTLANYNYLEQYDLDYGVGGAMLIPNTTLSVSNSKEGNLFLLDDNHLGKYTAGNDSVLQIIAAAQQTGYPLGLNYGTPIYYHYFSQSDTECIYVWAATDSLKQLFFNRSGNKFDLTKTIRGTIALSQSSLYGPVLTVSSDGTNVGTGIVWVLRSASNFGSQGLLEAYDARDIRHLLWSSNMGTAANRFGNLPKFNTAVVANGKVYVPSFSNKLYIYGLFKPHVNTGIFEKYSNVRFANLYPNPTSESITLNYNLTKPLNDLTVRINDFLGRTLMSIPLLSTAGEHTQTISLNNQFKPGIYYIEYISSENLYGYSRFIKY